MVSTTGTFVRILLKRPMRILGSPALRQHHGDVGAAARELGIKGGTLNHWIRKLGIEVSRFRPPAGDELRSLRTNTHEPEDLGHGAAGSGSEELQGAILADRIDARAAVNTWERHRSDLEAAAAELQISPGTLRMRLWDLGWRALRSSGAIPDLAEKLVRAEMSRYRKAATVEVMQRHKGNAKAAAGELRVPLATFYAQLRLWGIAAKEFRRLPAKDTIIEALRRHKGNAKAAATELQVSRRTLYRLMKRCGVRAKDFRCLPAEEEAMTAHEQEAA